jgi:micrococcal nuclease
MALLTIALLVLASCTASPSTQTALSSWNAFDHVQFHKCYDGDTCIVSLPGLPDVFGDRISIRLVGIDAPEIKAAMPCSACLACRC